MSWSGISVLDFSMQELTLTTAQGNTIVQDFILKPGIGHLSVIKKSIGAVGMEKTVCHMTLNISVNEIDDSKYYVTLSNLPHTSLATVSITDGPPITITITFSDGDSLNIKIASDGAVSMENIGAQNISLFSITYNGMYVEF